MRTPFRVIGLSAVAAIAAFAIAQDAWTLKRVAKVGDTSKYKLTAEIDIGGQQAKLSGRIAEKVTAVEPDGGFTVESTQSGLVVAFGDQEMEIPDSGATTTKFGPKGEVLQIAGEQTDGSAYRMANLGSFRFPDKPVKVGDEWTVEIPANAETGAAKATASFKVEGTEELGGKQTLKVKVLVKETEGTEPASSDGTVWVNPTDGNLVKAEATWLNAPLPGAPGPVTAKVSIVQDA